VLIASEHDPGSRSALADRRNAFRALHARGCFVIPNPWDVGSARYLQRLGFPALATTSAGFAFSQGLPDSGDQAIITRDRSLAYIASITAGVDLPVSADFMSGYGLEPEDVAESVARCVATGVAGLSIEDSTGDPSSPLYDLPLAVRRIRAARWAIDQSGEDVLLTARAECYHVGHPDAFRESIRRLQAYAEAGADVLFAPGPHEAAEIKALVDAVRPKPFNLLVVRDLGLRVGDIADLGVRRISVGGALALAAWTGFINAAEMLKSEGSFAGLGRLVPYAELNGLFAADRPCTRHRDGRAWEGNMFGWGGSDEPGPQTESPIERGFRLAGPVDNEWGRSESLDPDNVGDIADEGTGHRG
jgi:2-methylisocitrate lyase-like PEP mutase family enzyme